MDDNQTLEILRMARELVINEYVDRRAQEHNQWLSQSEALWATKKMRLPYPTIPPYPTEDVIVARAQKLFAFIENPTGVDESVPTKPLRDALVALPPKDSLNRVEHIQGDWTSMSRY